MAKNLILRLTYSFVLHDTSNVLNIVDIHRIISDWLFPVRKVFNQSELNKNKKKKKS